MTSQKQELQAIEDQLVQLDEQIKAHCIAWAQEKVQSPGKEEIPGEITTLQTILEDMDSEEGEIQGKLDEKEKILGQLKEIKDKENEEEKSLSDFHIVLGKRSFDLYKKGSLTDRENLDDLFKPLLDWEDRIRNADNELYRIRSGSEEKNVLKKVQTFLKKSSQSTIKKTAGDSLGRYYGKVGERLIGEGLFPEIAQNGLSDIYAEFQEQEERSRRLRDDQDSLEKQLGTLDLRLEELCGGTKPARYLKKKEEEKESRETELDEAYLRMGQSLYAREDLNRESFKQMIDELNGQRDRKSKEKSLCLTGIRIAELDEAFQKKDREKQQQQEKVQKETDKLNLLSEEAEELEKKKAQLEKEQNELKAILSE